ncbi:hypothetical protein B484DRAFT_476203, partial [Ochromonadaceae sp. CCMP2298]
MGSGASALHLETSQAIRIVPASPKYSSKHRKYRFDLADESTLTDCFTARASWYKIQSTVIPSGKTLSVFMSSAKIFRPFYQRLFASNRSTLLQTSATFQSLFLEDLCSILLAGVTSFDAVGQFCNQYKSIQLKEYCQIGETLIETLLEVLPMRASTGDLTTLTFFGLLDHSSDPREPREPRELSTDTTLSVRTTTYEEEGGKLQESSQWILAWVRLYGKFQRHLWAVMIGHPQPKGHPSMYASE